MDSSRPESLIYSPSVKRSPRHRSPRKSTPKRLYLRQSFPTVVSPPSTTPTTSPGDAFQHRQQLLQDAKDEKERERRLEKPQDDKERHRLQQRQQRLLNDLLEQRGRQDGEDDDDATTIALAPATIVDPKSMFHQPSPLNVVNDIDNSNNSDRGIDNGNANDGRITLQSATASTVHAQQAQEISDALARILAQSASAKSRAAAKSLTTTTQLSSSRATATASAATAAVGKTTAMTDLLSASVAPRLRTTETEYDVSPDRSTRLLSTPPRSLYSGTPSRPRTTANGDHFNDSFLSETDPAPPSPSARSLHDRYSRHRQKHQHQHQHQQREQERILRNNAAMFNQASSLQDELARAPEWSPHSPLNQDHEQVQEEQTEEPLDERDDEQEILQDEKGQDEDQGEEYEDEDDQGYDYVDEEVSFKRPALTSSSNQSTLVNTNTHQSYSPYHRRHDNDNNNYREEEEEEEEERREEVQEEEDNQEFFQHQYSRSANGHTRTSPFLGRHHRQQLQQQKQQQSASYRTPVQNGHISDIDAENSLFEAAEKTAAITEDLRGVYSNLQEFFSPETEAKRSSAITLLSAQKMNGGSAGRRATDERFAATSVPKPLVFETSPSTAQRTPVITKRKPAPLRSAVMPKHSTINHRHSEREQQHVSSSSTSHPRHDVTLRGLVSDADSARRLSQGKRDKHARRSLENGSAISSSQQQQQQQSQQRQRASPHPRSTTPVPFHFETEPLSERHQERFLRKLDRWKRVERQNLGEAPPLPTYPDLYIPTLSSRPRVVGEYEDEEYEEEQNDEDDDNDYYDEEDGEGEPFERHGDLRREYEERERAVGANTPGLEDEAYRERIIQDLTLQIARENELRERRARRALEEEQAAGDYEELLDRRGMAKRRREAAFWS
ncbi:hypothetical protein BGZ99_004041 [Dissophora globulifera]|uniref:Uncharacterized protein n=1 Tax=Dissophora globulifera TaxID=979702 RepID=A0A9P6RMT9_9FUNG|nr:hypothetical protein BGZ99_004041 [Dissophora globulifera]